MSEGRHPVIDSEGLTLDPRLLEPPPKVSFINDPRMRAMLVQLALVVGMVWLLGNAVFNAYRNLQDQKMASGYDFLVNVAGFAIAQTPIPYTEASTYGRAFLIGLLNTLIVAVLGVIFATVLGFLVGIARLSRNWVVAKIAYWYVEIIRNLPLLFQIIFWHLVLLNALPGPRESLSAGPFYLNNRGLTLPRPVFGDMAWVGLAGLVIGIVLMIVMRRWARARQQTTGQQFPVFWTGLALVVITPLLALMLVGMPVAFDLPEKGTFRLTGGLTVLPEFIALLVALTAYTAAFIAEIVRAGILAVSHGQTEAGRSLGLPEGRILNLIVVPQALRVIIPPLTSQYLNITKNSSLATAIGYPDLVSVGGTILNQTARAIEIVSLWMLCYLTVSVLTSIFMNWYNQRIALTER